MPHDHRIVSPSRIQGTVLSESDERLTPPEDWDFLAAGDAAVTRKVKAMGPTWVVRIKKGRRFISKGIWAQKTHIITAQNEVKANRSTPQYAKKREGDLARREKKHQAYIEEFRAEVMNYLDFHPRYLSQAKLIAEKVTIHATPVGSGTVARTEQIPIAKRAEAAVIAWMRHKTTSYDSMKVPRIKGKRREIRRHLAIKSIDVLSVYRQGHDLDLNCPLKRALS